MKIQVECNRVMLYDYSAKMKFAVAQFKKINVDGYHTLFALTTRYDGDPPYTEGKKYKITIEEESA